MIKPKKPVKRVTNRTDEIRVPAKSQGLNFPQRLLVLSTTFPSRGLTKISAIRMITIRLVIIPIKRSAIWLETPVNITDVTKTIK